MKTNIVNLVTIAFYACMKELMVFNCTNKSADGIKSKLMLWFQWTQ